MAGAQGETEGPAAASGSQRALASLIDMALAGIPVVIAMRRSMAAAGERPRDRSGRMRALEFLGPLRAAVEEQIGSPGTWVAGIRRVDERTGRRLALWRTLVLLAVRLVLHEAARRSGGLAHRAVAERPDAQSGVAAIVQRFPDDRTARDAALMEYDAANRVSPSAAATRPLGLGLASIVLNHLLRRRLARTTLVARPRRARPS